MMSRMFLLVTLMLLAGCATTTRQSRQTGPWDLTALRQVPAATWGAVTGLVQEVYYAGEPLQGQPTRVFAYLGRPANRSVGKLPGMLLVHGGGGKAFKEWAEHWARRGYVALAMDLSGNGPGGRLPDGGPDQADASKFREFDEAGVRDMWSYHAVAAVLRGHSLLASLPDVDAERIGVTGISWGGYLTCIVAGLDERLKVAVPVYGCGFLGDNSAWKAGSLARLTPASRDLWLRCFDPQHYLPGVKCPILFLNGTTDFAYPLDSYQKSYSLVRPDLRTLSVVVSLPHGHIWTFEEVDAFVDSAIRHGKPLARPGAMKPSSSGVSAMVKSRAPLRKAELHYTTDTGEWQKRKWQTIPAQLAGKRAFATLPVQGPLVCYLSVTDERGLRTSTPHREISASEKSIRPLPGPVP